MTCSWYIRNCYKRYGKLESI